MAILSRKVNEAIIIFTKEGEITIRMIEKSGKKTYFGIDAPASMKICREELVKRDIDEQNKLSTS